MSATPHDERDFGPRVVHRKPTTTKTTSRPEETR